MSSSAAAAQFKLDANSNAIALIADVASLPLALPLSPTSTTTPTATGASATATATATPADRVEWSRSTILNFIEDYRRQRVLWDPNTKGYHIKQTKYEALKLLSHKYGTEIRSIRSKIKSLRSSFHREHGKVLSGRSRGVIYQPMWFAYEAIRFILDGERDQDQVGQDQDPDGEADTEADEKLTLMHSLDLEQLKADKLVDRDIIMQVEQQQQQQHDELTARIAATVAAVAAAAAAANARDRERDGDTAGSDMMDPAREMELEEAAAGGALIESSSAAVTRSSSDLDGENYCNISAEDVKTEIIEHESELGMLDRRTSTPSPINYYKPTDLTYNHRKRKAMGVEHVVGALTLTPIKAVGGAAGSGTGSGGSAGQQQLAFQALQQHFNHNHSLSLSHCNGQPHNHQHQQHQQQQQSLHLQQQQQQQQQHSSNMAHKRDRDRDLSTSNGNSNTNCNNNNSNNNNNNSSSHNASNISMDPTATSSNCSSSSNSGATPPKLLIGGGGLSVNHVDEYGVFGEYVAITIRKLKTSKSKIVVKHLINNLLYEAELGKYDHGMPASKEPPQLYNMQ
ncbi:mediator of RNA polymerase II transcription subunit 2 [Drosophila elegans]|uniref:mediator of RNA polymerase II transcription subunit 2 n=1 Tax=Drosophila elegans TaxID=30023 RepID=UPI0007E7EE58|nr:mediator of RNA polymerase II transcription subunit 2 [Drosophila elegans]